MDRYRKIILNYSVNQGLLFAVGLHAQDVPRQPHFKRDDSRCHIFSNLDALVFSMSKEKNVVY